jgi:lysine-specific permease
VSTNTEIRKNPRSCNSVNGIGTKEELKRSLKVRHTNMIAIGGAIGTGLFVASGASISTAGLT